VCPQGRTTKVESAESMAECVCARDSYEPLGTQCRSSNDTCTCVNCMVGLDCMLGSRLEAWVAQVKDGVEQTDTTPLVMQGYYSLPEDPVSIFKCQEEEACSGGQPASCAGGRIFLTCTRCPGGFYLGSDRMCHECEGHEIVVITSCMPLAVAAVTLAHMAVNWPIIQASQWTMTSVLLAGMGVTTCLTFNIYANLAFEIVPPLSHLFGALKILAFDAEMLRFSCVSGSDSQLVRYATKLLSIPLAFLCLSGGAFCVHLVPRLRKYAAFTVVGLQNSIGMIVTIFFITISLMSLEAFRCDLHPNGKTSLSVDRSVLCWESPDHAELVVLSVIAILCYPIPFLVVTGCMTYNYGAGIRRFGSAFTLSSRFLFNRMGPDFFAFGFWYNCRNFVLTLVPIIAANQYNLQVNMLMMCFLGWLLVQMTFKPWRFEALNKFDAFTSAMQILMLNCFAMLGAAGGAADSDNAAQVAGWTIIVLFSFILLGIVVLGTTRLMRRVWKTKDYAVFLSHHKDSAGRFARQIKMMISQITSRRIFLDVDELQNLDSLNFTVRSNTDNVMVLMTPDTLNRLGVAVEITSAFMNHVPIHMVAASSTFHGTLDEAFLAEVPNMWSELDIDEFRKVGIELFHVEATYRFLATLPMRSFHIDVSFDEQWSQAKSLMREMSACPVKNRHWKPDPACHVYLGFDSMSDTQTSAARILSMSFQQAHWTAHLLHDVLKAHVEDNAVAVVLLSKTFVGNANAVGFVTAMHMKCVPIITVRSGEAFWKPDMQYFTELRAGKIFSWQQLAQLHLFAPEATLDSTTDSINKLYNILAWRFNPEGTEMVMRTEFQRILERAEVERKRGKALVDSNPLMSDIIESEVSVAI